MVCKAENKKYNLYFYNSERIKLENKTEEQQIKWQLVENQIRKTISEQLGVKLDEVKDAAKFQETLDADSLDMVEVVMALEEDFGIQIQDDDVEALKTVRQMIDHVRRVIEVQEGIEPAGDSPSSSA